MVKLVVDSSSDCRLQDEIVDVLIPMNVNIDGKEYLAGVDLNCDQFYELLQNCKEFPRTAQPSPHYFIDLFERAKADGDQIIYLCLSSRLSGTYQSALLLKEMVDYDDIYIIDTLGATHIINMLALYARSLINQGLTAAEIADKCEIHKTKIKLYAGINTLEYLYKGGRLSKASATVGELTGIKPIVTVTDGRVDAIAKCLGKVRTMNSIIDRMKSHKINSDFPIFSLYTSGVENCEAFEEKLKENGYEVTKRLQVGSTIGTHVGPGSYAVVFVIE